jgi:asparagine synthase (glutamine-hydrolysing)
VRTFTVKFDQSARHDEAPIAKRVAQQMGFEHHELPCSDLTQDDFTGAVAALDQPFGDASYLPVSQLCRLARASITVALGGDGGDELFGGYPRYLSDEGDYPDNPLWSALRHTVERGLLPASLYRATLRGRQRVLRHFSRMADYPCTSRGLRSILSPQGREALQPAAALAALRDSMLRWNGKMDRDSLMRADLWYFLSANCLHKTDRASMAHGLEARVPILGRPVLDLMLPQPAGVKLAHGLKSVLMPLAQRHLPREVWDRPKRGFTVPVESYLLGGWRGYCQGLIEACPRIAPFLNAAEVRRRWDAMAGGRKIDWPLYETIVLLGWLEHHRLQL